MNITAFHNISGFYPSKRYPVQWCGNSELFVFYYNIGKNKLYHSVLSSDFTPVSSLCQHISQGHMCKCTHLSQGHMCTHLKPQPRPVPDPAASLLHCQVSYFPTKILRHTDTSPKCWPSPWPPFFTSLSQKGLREWTTNENQLIKRQKLRFGKLSSTTVWSVDQR